MARQSLKVLQDTVEDGETLSDETIIVKVDDFHLGYSRLAAYLECPKSYKYTYVDGIRSPGSPVMRRGTAFHEVMEDLFNFKAGYGKLMPIERVEKCVNKRCANNKICPSAATEVLAAVLYFYEKRYPLLDPALLMPESNESPIEGKFVINRGGVEITGRIDLASETKDGLEIHDYKFSNKPWDKDRITHSVQPMIYQWAGIDWGEPNFGIPYVGFQYEVINVWPQTQMQLIRIPRLSQKQSDWWEEQIEAFAQAIKTGIFPANPSDTVCGWCNHKAKCKPVIYDINIELISGFQLSEDQY